MADAVVSKVTGMLAALSQGTRLKIVEFIAQGRVEGTPAGEIARAVDCPASTLSFHLKELTQAGLLAAAPQGRFIRYSVRPQAFSALAGFIARLPAVPPAATPAAKPAASRRGKRAAKAEERAEGGREGQLSIFGD
jgi:DNA-binding transcriptional ArsR family regulator